MVDVEVLVEDSGDHQSKDERRDESDRDAHAPPGTAAREITGLRPTLGDADGNDYEREQCSVEKRLEDQRRRRDFKSCVKEIEGDKNRGEEADRMEILMGNEFRHA